MVGAKLVIKRGGRDEAEKPFWISFADLMTALMVLFLVVMGVALLAVTKNVTEREKAEEQHRKDIERILERFPEQLPVADSCIHPVGIDLLVLDEAVLVVQIFA